MRILCSETYSKFFFEFHAVHLFKFHVLRPPCFSAPAKLKLKGSNDAFLEADIVRNYIWGRYKVLLLLNEYGHPSFLKINGHSLNENLLSCSSISAEWP